MNKKQVIPFADVAEIEPSCAVEYAIEIGDQNFNDGLFNNH